MRRQIEKGKLSIGEVTSGPEMAVLGAGWPLASRLARTLVRIADHAPVADWCTTASPPSSGATCPQWDGFHLALSASHA